MTGERGSNTGGETGGLDVGHLIITRSRGQRIFIFVGNEQLINVTYEFMEREGPKLSIGATGQFERIDKDSVTSLTTEEGQTVFISAAVDPHDSNRAKVSITAPKDFRILREEQVEPDSNRRGSGRRY